MPVKQSWPRTDRRLLYANLVVYAAMLLVVAIYHGELRWAARSLDAYVRTGDYPATADRQLVGKARQYGSAHEGDFDGVADYLERAVAVDPNGVALFLLAGLEASRGEDDLALELYERYRAIDAYDIEVYEAMVAIFERRGDWEAAERLLAEGVELFRDHATRQTPRPDPAASSQSNEKARMIHETARRGLEKLERALTHLRELP
jgi:tetratricopeptide (TPR) repeat protein